MSDQALEALSASLGTRKPEPELDLSSIKEVDEVLTLDSYTKHVVRRVMKLNVLTQFFFFGD